VSLSTEARAWLRLQLILAALGAIVWYGGVVAGSDFASGFGVGILVTALALRFLKRGE
jgi:hypothetical protein